VVLRHLYAILMFVFLNMFVTLRICGEVYVNARPNKHKIYVVMLKHGKIITFD